MCYRKVILMKKEKILLLYKAYAKSTLSVEIAKLQKQKALTMYDACNETSNHYYQVTRKVSSRTPNYYLTHERINAGNYSIQCSDRRY